MDFESISNKHSNEMEQLVTQLLKTMRNAKLQDSPLYANLQEFERELGDMRRKRFDENNSKYSGY